MNSGVGLHLKYVFETEYVINGTMISVQKDISQQYYESYFIFSLINERLITTNHATAVKNFTINTKKYEVLQ